jgi:peptide/nickel transport system ATP-binding protein
MAEKLLRADNVRVRFQTPKGSLLAVDDVSFSVDRGQTLAIVGESGSGKSVLVRSVMNLLGPNATVEGTIRFEGRDIKELSRAEAKHFWGQEIGMVFQDPMTSLNPTKRIGTQLAEGLRFHRDLGAAESRRICLDLLDQVRVSDAARRLSQYPHELSGGMRQRVVMAMALACEPKLLIADEPTTALDVTVQKKLLDLLDQLRRDRHMGLILITHDLGIVKGRADDIVVMYAGRVMEHARTAELFGGPLHPYTNALLRSIPHVDQPSHTRLVAIPGRPPNLLHPPPGCRFAPRCSRAGARCAVEDPSLFRPEPRTRAYACFHPGDDRAPLAVGGH